jgi:hypothetical protein
MSIVYPSSYIRVISSPSIISFDLSVMKTPLSDGSDVPGNGTIEPDSMDTNLAIFPSLISDWELCLNYTIFRKLKGRLEGDLLAK